MEEKQKKKMSTIKFLWQVIRGKVDLGEETHSKAMTLLVASLFNFLSGLLFVFSIIILGGTIYIAATSSWASEFVFNNIGMIIIVIVGVVLGMVMSFLLRVIALGIEKEKDKHYVLAMFSGLTGFIALIISLIALLK